MFEKVADAVTPNNNTLCKPRSKKYKNLNMSALSHNQTKPLLIHSILLQHFMISHGLHNHLLFIYSYLFLIF